MTRNHDRPKVYRVQGLPDHPGFDRLAAAQLVASAVGDPTVTADDIHISSLATTAEPHKRWNRKVATLMFRHTPSALITAVGASSSVASEWQLPVPGQIEPLILDTHFLGLTVLNDVSVAEHRFDCLVISGLASHPFGSWQPKGDDKSYMWIRDTLPNYVDGVRYILYGYDTTLKDSTSFQTIVDLANTLYLTLQSHGWASPSTKPLMFLAHSLGGVLLKQLLVMLAGANDSTRFMLSMIKGAIFFGTPSRCMAMGQLLAMVGDQPNHDLVELLSETSDFLSNLETQFSGISQIQRMRLYWAYETKTSPTVQKVDGSYKRSGPRSVMVDWKSATGSRTLDPSFTIQIDEDHSGMVKFNRGDRRMPIIISKLQEIRVSSKTTDEIDTFVTPPSVIYDPHHGSDSSYSGADLLEDARNSELVGWDYDLIISLLKAPERDQRQEQIAQNFGHTFSWIFDNHEIGLSQWLRKGEGIFWINGKPGSGKSTLMKFLLNHKRTKELLHHWKSQPGRTTASFFFHHRGTHLQKSFEGLLGSLLSQLLSGDLRLHKIVGDLQSEKAAQFYETIQSDVNSFFQLCNIQHVGIAHQKRMVTLLSENPSRRLHRIIEQEALHMTYADRVSIKQTLLSCFDRLSSANRSKRAYVTEEQSACEKLLLQYPQYDKPIQAIVSRWCEGLDMSGRVRKLLKEAQMDILKPNDEQHLIRLIERQKARLKRLINNHLIWWTEVNPEEGLQQIFNQNTFDLEVCLFFDALDEYDGSPEFISSFLREIVQRKPTSKTRTKILFSSRPWPIFRDHFQHYPSISIHQYTKDDIEQYCTGFLPRSSRAQRLTLPFVGEIANRACGVFLWVKLVMSDLAALVRTPGQSDKELSRMLRQCLDDLPDELDKYYSTIVQRLPASTRRESYILLECISKSPTTISLHEIPALLACGVSESLHEAQDVIESERAPGFKDPGGHVRTISGGMVDLVPRRGLHGIDTTLHRRRPLEATESASYTLQLMHQTVKDWVALPTFKHNILGARADMTWQNGHSFLVKYYFHRIASEPGSGLRLKALEHAIKAEMTTGVSQYPYLSQLPKTVLRRATSEDVTKAATKISAMPQRHPFKEAEQEQKKSVVMQRREAHIQGSLDTVIYGLELAALGGLSLYLEDSIRHDRLVFRRSVGPLLSIALMEVENRSAAHQSDMAQGILASVELILNNGFNIQSDTAALSLIFEGIWTNVDQRTAGMYINLVIAAIRNGLPVGGRFDIRLDPGNPTSLLHLSPPILAKYLLGQGADPNELNRAGQSPLDYILDTESVFHRSALGLDWLYDVVQLLVQNGAQQGIGKRPEQRLQGQKLPQRLDEDDYDISPLLWLQPRSMGEVIEKMPPLALPTGSRVTEVRGRLVTDGKRSWRDRLARIFHRSGVSSG